VQAIPDSGFPISHLASRIIMVQTDLSVGLYFHVPFCLSRCGYCHFLSLPYDPETAARYARALLREIDRGGTTRPPGQGIDSIYLGGGTPSVMPADFVPSLLRACRRFPPAGDCEISMEANPGTLSREKVDAWKRSGVNRVSLGAQSFTDSELAGVGRTHTSAMTLDSIRLLRRGGIRNLNLDLMLGLPGQTRRSWTRSLEAAARLHIEHLSVYMLDLDEACTLQAEVSRGALRLPEEELIADLYLETIAFLEGCGYRQYEISNFSLPGYACRHNLKYWLREPVVGFGLGSHSFDGGSRWANTPEMELYLKAMDEDGDAVAFREPVDAARSLQETLFLGLRLNQGLDWRRLQEVYGMDSVQKHADAIRDLFDRGFLQMAEGKVRLTPSGMLVSNEIFQLFV